MIAAATLITVAAVARTESRGSHWRTDHPAADPAQARRVRLTLAEAQAIRADLLEMAP